MAEVNRRQRTDRDDTEHRPAHHYVTVVDITYLCSSLLVEHGPSTIPRHRTLFWAALVIPGQLVPCCFSSASVSRLQLLRGRPLFLFSCGFQARAWRVVLDAGFLRDPAPIVVDIINNNDNKNRDHRLFCNHQSFVP